MKVEVCNECAPNTGVGGQVYTIVGGGGGGGEIEGLLCDQGRSQGGRLGGPPRETNFYV